MWYDWMVGGWGGRNGRDGSTATAPIFGVGLAVQPLEGQERLCPVLTSRHEIVTDTGGPGTLPRRLRRREGRHAHGCRARPSCPTAATARARSPGASTAACRRSRTASGSTRDARSERFLGAVFSNVPVRAGRPLHAPVGGRRRLRRPPRARPRGRPGGRRRRVRLGRARARRDYGVVVEEVDADLDEYRSTRRATERERARHRVERAGWLEEDAEDVARALSREASSTCSTSCGTTA